MIVVILQVICVSISFFGAASMLFLIKDYKILHLKKNYTLIGIFITYCLFFTLQILTYSAIGREIDTVYLYLLDFAVITVIVFGIIFRILFITIDSEKSRFFYLGIVFIIIISLLGIIIQYFSYEFYFSSNSDTFISNLEFSLILLFLLSFLSIVSLTISCSLQYTQKIFFPIQYRYLINHQQLNLFGILVLLISIGESLTVTSTGALLDLDQHSTLVLVIIGSSLALICFLVLFNLIYKSRDHYKDIAWNIISMQLQELQELDRVKDQFLSITSHELRSPLTSIIWSVEFLKKDIEKSSNISENEYLDTIERNVIQIRRIIEDVIDITKIEKNLFTYNIEKEILENIIYYVIKDIKNQADSKQIELKFNNKLKMKNQLINVDSDRISQVLRNLIENAIKFSNKGEIEVSLEDSLLYYIISVKDTGIGIAKNKISSIFEPFTKSDDNKYTKGLGLGLYIAKKIVEDHRGEIKVTSELGKGSTFTFTLPKNKN